MNRSEFERELLQSLPRLRSHCLALTRNQTAADDLTQATVELAIRYAGQYVDDGKFLAWLRMIALNRFRTDHRRTRRDLDLVVSLDDDAYERPALEIPVASRADDLLFLREVARVAEDALSEEQVVALNLLVMEDLSYKDLSDLLGMSVGGAKSMVHRARERLRAVIAG